MPVITINGVIGSGTLEIGHLVAQNMGINYVDRYIFAEAARLVGSPISQLIEKEQRVVPFREKVARFMQGVLERSAVAGAGAEPYFGRGIEMLPAEAYTELMSDAAAASPVQRPGLYRRHYLGNQRAGGRRRCGNLRTRGQYDTGRHAGGDSTSGW